MKYINLTFILLIFTNCVATSNNRGGGNAKVEKDRLLNFYTGEIANVFGTKLNDAQTRKEFFNSRNDFDVSQWIRKHLSAEIQDYERKIEDDWRNYLLTYAPSQIVRDSDRLYRLVDIIGEDFKLMVEIYLIGWKKRND